MNRPLRVVHFTSDSRIAGTETMLLRLFRHYDREAFDFHLVTLFGPGDLIEAARALGVPGEQIEWNRACSPGAFLRLHRLLRRLSPDILQCYLFHSNLIGRAAGRLARVPMIVSGQRTFFEESAQGQRQRAWDRRTFFLTHYSLANSKAGADSLYSPHEPQRARIEVVPNGIPLEGYGRLSNGERRALRGEWGVPEDAFAFGMVAQLRRHKDHHSLIAATAQLPDAHTVLVGSGDEEDHIRGVIAEHKVQDRVHLLGYRSDIPRVLGALDAFVLSTEIEGLPVSVMEAMATGLPIVATHVGGVPELVLDGETGLLVAMNSVEELREAMRRLADDSSLAHRMGEAGRARIAREFTPEAMTRRIEDFYRRIAAERLR